MSETKDFDPRKSINKIIKDLRKRKDAANLNALNDDDLFGIILTAYETGAQDTINAVKPQFEAFDKALAAREDLKVRLITLNGLLTTHEDQLNKDE